MPRDLHQLLHDTAVEPDSAPEVDQLVRRGHRRRRIRHGATALGSAAVVAVVVAIGGNVATGPTAPPIVDQPPSAPPTTPTATSSPPTDTARVVLTPVKCPPNASCLPAFHLDGVKYMTTPFCDQVAPSAISEPTHVIAEGASNDVPASVYSLEGFPAEVGVAVDWHCNDRALAFPVEVPADREHALQQARLRCQTLADPAPSDRCELGGDATWRTGGAWYDKAFAPFPEAVEAADLAIEAGEPDSTWRTDPLEVATRRFADEGVCKDQGSPCRWDVALSQEGDDRAVVEGTVHPFPNVIWDIRIVVERLGEDSWWTTRMTIEPRPAE